MTIIKEEYQHTRPNRPKIVMSQTDGADQTVQTMIDGRIGPPVREPRPSASYLSWSGTSSWVIIRTQDTRYQPVTQATKIFRIFRILVKIELNIFRILTFWHKRSKRRTMVTSITKKLKECLVYFICQYVSLIMWLLYFMLQICSERSCILIWSPSGGGSSFVSVRRYPVSEIIRYNNKGRHGRPRISSWWTEYHQWW